MDEDKFEKARVIKDRIDVLYKFIRIANKNYEMWIQTLVRDSKITISVKGSVKEGVLDVLQTELDRLKDEFDKI